MALATWFRKTFHSTLGPALAAMTLALVSMSTGNAMAQAINNPPLAPIVITAFPQRDFVHADGYNSADRCMVRVIHSAALGGAIFTTDPANWVVPQSDPKGAIGAPFAGIVEVNHPGGACWFGTTPDIRPGDRVQVEVMAGPNLGRIDETTVAFVTASRPVQSAIDAVQVHGTAMDAFGAPLPLAEIEARLVANRQQFNTSGTRTLRGVGLPAVGDGVLAYDAPGATTWTATFTGLDGPNVVRALGAETRGIWLGTAILPAVGSTIYEIGALTFPGPAAPCAAALEILPPPPGSELIPPTDPSNLTATVSNFNTVTLNWNASTDNVDVTAYGIYRDGVALFTVTNPNGAANPPTTFVDLNTPPGNYTYTVNASDAVGNQSGFSNGASATTVAQPDQVVGVINEPPVLPVNIITFPSRDFVSPSGFLASDQVTVQVIRNGIIVGTASGIIPQADPKAAPGDPFAGFAEVNHPGGACWGGVTPEMRAGDIIRTIAFDPTGAIRTIDQTHVSGVTAFKPVLVQDDNVLTPQLEGIIEIHATALGANGQPIPIDQLEQRMIANRDAFDLNGRRALRAGLGLNGTLTYDTANNPMGVNVTARYEGLSADDVARAIGGTSLSTGRVFPGAMTRMHWMGTNPLTLSEATIFENSPDLNPPGPAAPVCFSPLEAADLQAPTVPGGLNASQASADDVQLTWSASADDWYVAGYRIYQDGAPIANVDPLTTSFMVRSVAVGAHTYDVRAYDTASPRGAGATIIEQIGNGFGNLYGNLSAASNVQSLTQLDVTAPSVPTNLVAVAGAGEATLTWLPCTDNVGVVSYGVYRDGGLIATVLSPLTTYLDQGLATGTYGYTVSASDAVPLTSAQSAPASVNVTGVADVTAPTIPGAVAASTSPDIHGRSVVVSWTASTDNVGVTGYGVYRNGVKIADVNGTTLSYSDLNLATATYAYSLDAFDSANNRSAQSAGSTAVVANDPPVAPHSLIAFPARDFISATGYSSAAGPYTFTLIRGGTVVASGAVNSDPTGLVEVNHPGVSGTCWLINTPNVRPGDVVRITNAAGIADQTTVANVTAQLPIATNANTVVIHGTAQDANGQPLPLGQIEHRLVSAGALFDLNGRRTLRAAPALDGTIAYDGLGSINWTATYSGLTASDMLRIVGGTDGSGTTFVASESRGIWLGRLPLALLEQTIHETGPGVVGGPAPGVCAAPAEAPVASASLSSTNLAYGNVSAIPPAGSAAQTIAFSNGGGAPLTISSVYLSGLNPGDFTIVPAVVTPVVLASGASLNVNVTFSPKAVGFRQARLSFACDAVNTTDLSATLSGTGINTTAPGVPGVPTASFTQWTNLTVTAANLQNSTIPVKISWTPSAGIVTSYRLQESDNGGPFVDTAIQPGLATSVTLNLAMGTLTALKPYQFQVAALNGTSASAFAQATKLNPIPIDQSNSSYVSFGGTWLTQTIAGTYGGNQRYALSTAANKEKCDLPGKITFTIQGSIAWIAVRGPDRGMATVSIDKGAAVLVDLYSPIPQLATVAFAANNLASGKQHSLTVAVLALRNAASSSNRVDVDGFVMLNGYSATAKLASVTPVVVPIADLAFSPIMPNPSASPATLSFAIPREGRVDLWVLDVRGRRVQTVSDGFLQAGQHQLTWDGNDASGQRVGAGVYFALLRYEGKALVQRIVRIR